MLKHIEDSASTDDSGAASRNRGVSVATRIITANARTTYVGALVLFLGIASLGGMGCMVIYTRQTRVSTTGVLVSSADAKPIATAKVIAHDKLLNLPTWENHQDFNSIQEITYSTPAMEVEANETETARQLESWRWESKSRMVLELAGDATMLIDSGSMMVLEKPTAVIFFNASGVGSMVGDQDGDEEYAIERVQDQCAALACPLLQCVGSLSVAEEMMEVHDVKCMGVTIWSWPTSVSLAATPIEDDNVTTTRSTTRRSLQSGLTCPYCFSKDCSPDIRANLNGRADTYGCSHCCAIEDEFYDLKSAFTTDRRVNPEGWAWPGKCSRRGMRSLSNTRKRNCRSWRSALRSKYNGYKSCVRDGYYNPWEGMGGA